MVTVEGVSRQTYHHLVGCEQWVGENQNTYPWLQSPSRFLAKVRKVLEEEELTCSPENLIGARAGVKGRGSLVLDTLQPVWRRCCRSPRRHWCRTWHVVSIQCIDRKAEKNIHDVPRA